MPLKEILPILSESKNGLAVTDNKNKIIGVITSQGVIKVMASAALNKKKNQL